MNALLRETRDFQPPNSKWIPIQMIWLSNEQAVSPSKKPGSFDFRHMKDTEL
jgi:hypothetical protein